MRAFASDNYAGVHPDVLAALAEANADHAVSYGADPWTERAREALRRHFGADASPWLVFNGTAANVLALGALCRRWEAVITPASSHVNMDEGGAPERMAGVKVITVPTPDGKLVPEQIPPLLGRLGDEHAVQPRIVSIANATELGTVYSVEETRAIADVAHAHGLLLHVDGSRIANAAVSLGVGLGELTTQAGADAVSVGLTKLGAMGAEAVVFSHGAPDGFAWMRKGQSQLASKMRFLAAQVVALYEGDLWQRLATHANAMASALATGAGAIDGVEVRQAVQANGVFAVVDPAVAEAARAEFPFYTWDEATGEVRWMCSWDTSPEDVEAFTSRLSEASHGAARAAATG